MPASVNPRSRHQVVAVGILAGLVGLGVPWISIRLSTGSTGGAGWSDFSPVSFSLTLAGVAAWGATLLTRWSVTRALSGLQTLIGGFAAVEILRALDRADDVAVKMAGEIGGVIGAFGPQDITWGWNAWAVGLALSSTIAITLGGFFGVLAPGSKRHTRSRYEQPNGSAADNPWDALTEGSDPTAR